VGARFKTVFLVASLVALALLTPSAHAAFPGANGKIAFVRNFNEISTMNQDGSDQVSLTGDNFSAPYGQDPVWSPDGSRIAYMDPFYLSSNAPQLFVMNADGSGKTHLGNNVTPDREPSWSPDGTEIAFIIAGKYFKTPADSSNYVQLPGETGGGLTLDWSPDGQAIAYSHTCEPSSGSSYIGIMESTPPYERTPVTSPTTCEGENRVFPYWDARPSWSPDGHRILFSRQVGFEDSSTLYTIRPDGTDMRPVKSYAGRVQGRWSPDATKIVVAFVTATGPPGGCAPCIRVMNADGTGETPIAQGTDPDWQPIPINAYPRPRGATPMRLPLVPAGKACTTPNRTHGAPLSFGSCAPPQLTSTELTTGTPDANGKRATMDSYLQLNVAPGNPATPLVDEADVAIAARIDNVFKGDLTDYTGSLRVSLPVRITDKNNNPAPGGPGAATTQPFQFGFNVPCTASADSQVGSDCALSTTADSLVPGAILERRRAIWQIGRARVDDAGPDGDPDTATDNTVFAVQGVFIP
jgi:Tol biopolymer transport system component